MHAENRLEKGLNSTPLRIATTALRAILYTDCDYTTQRNSKRLYQGCFRDAPSAPDMAPAESVEQPSLQLRVDGCALACAAHPFFGIRGGNECLCGGTFGRYGAVDDAECDLGCTADADRPCGGVNRTSIYRQARRQPRPLPPPNLRSARPRPHQASTPEALPPVDARLLCPDRPG